VIVTGNDRFWLLLDPQDAAALRFPLQVLLDQENLTQRYDDKRYSDARHVWTISDRF
jgi:hypothetical protein